jgi:translocation and assembly module TamB
MLAVIKENKKMLPLILILFLLVLSTLVLYLNWSEISFQIKKEIVNSIENKSGFETRVEQIEVKGVNRLQINELKLKDKKGNKLFVDKVDLTYALRDIIFKKTSVIGSIKEVNLISPKVDLDKKFEYLSNMEAQVDWSSLPILDQFTGKVIIENGILNAEISNKIDRIEDINGNLEYIEDELKIDLELGLPGEKTGELALQGVTDLQKFDLDVDLRSFRLSFFSQELQSILKKTGVQLEAAKLNAKVNLSGDLDFSSFNELDYGAELKLTQGILNYDQFSKKIRISDSKLIVKNDKLLIEELITNVGNSRLELSGSIDNWQRPEIYLNYSSSQLDMRLLKDYLPSGLKIIGQAEATGEIKGFLNNLIIKSKIKLATGKINNYDFQDLHFKLKYNNKFITLSDLKAKLATGVLNGRGTLNWSDNNELLYTASLEMNGVDLEKIQSPINSLNLAGKLDSSLIISGQNSLKDLSLFGSAKVYAGNLKGYKFDNLRSNFWFNNQRLLLSNLIMEKGESKWEARGLINADQTLNLDITAGKVNLADLAGLHNIQTLKGIASLQGELTGQISNPHFSGDIKIDDLDYQGRQITQITGNISYKAKRINLNNIALEHRNSDYELEGNIKFDNKPIFDLELRTIEGELRSLYKFVTGQERKEINGKVLGRAVLKGEIDDLKAEGKLRLLKGRIQEIDLNSGLLDFKWQNGKTYLKEFKVSGNDLILTGQGQIDNKGALNISLETKNLPLANLNLPSKNLEEIKGNLNFSGKLQGNIKDLDLIGEVNLDDVVVMDYYFKSIVGEVKYTGEKLDLKEIKVTKEASEYELDGSLDLREQRFSNLNLEMVNGKLAEIISLLPLKLEAPLPYSFYGEVWINGKFKAPEVEGKVLVGDIDQDGYLAFDGIYDFNSGTDLVLTTKDFSLNLLNSFVDWENNLAGDLNLKAKLKGKLDKLDIDSKLEIENGQIANLNYKSLTGELFLEDGGQLKVTRELTMVVDDQNLVTVSGYLPLWAKGEPLYIDVDFNKANLSLLSRWVSDVKSAQGNGSAEFTISGSRNNPNFNGRVNIVDGKLNMTNLPEKISKLNAVVDIKGQQININKFSGLYGGNEFKIKGWVGIDDWQATNLNLDFEGANIPFNYGSWQGENDVDLKLEGNIREPLIEGEILANDTRILIPFKWPGVSDGSVTSIEPKYNLRIKPGENVRVHNDNIDILVEEGELKLTTTEQGANLIGVLRSRTGNFTYYNTEFKLETGEAVFDSYRNYMPELDLTASAEIMNIENFQMDNNLESTSQNNIDESNITEVKVMLDLTGPAEQLDINLTSDPSLSRSEIINLLAKQGGLGRLLNGDYEQAVQAELMRVIQTGVRVGLFSNIERTLEDKWDLDKFKIYSGFSSTWKLKMGKYLTDELFIKYNQAFNSEDERSIGFEYKIIDGLKDIILDGSMSNDDEYRLELEANFPFN